MKRAIIEWEEGEAPVGEGSTIVEIPITAAITITDNCGECGWLTMSIGKSRHCCGNHKIFHIKPYSTDRKVTLNTRPVWCPL